MNKELTNGFILDCVISSFSKVKLSKEYNCKVYSICMCAHETTIKINGKSKYFIEILLQNNNISDLKIIERNFFKNKEYSLLNLDTKQKFKKFNNETDLKKIIKKLVEITQKKIIELSNNNYYT